MRIIAGNLKHAEIPFVNVKFDHANATPQKIKKALFSIIGENIKGKSFLDIYACSGQIGIEAISRNAEFVVLNEIDFKRYSFIKSFIKQKMLENNSSVFNYHSFRCLRFLNSKKLTFDYIYIDPPYPKKSNEKKHFYEILKEINKYNTLNSGGKIIIQHLSKAVLNEDAFDLKYIVTKKYAKNSLSIYKKI